MGNANLKYPPTQEQMKGLVIVQRVMSIPSLIATTYIIQYVLRSEKSNRNTGIRLVFGMSCMDLLFSVVSFASAWPAPEGTPWVPGAIGTWKSCEAFGFLLQASRASSIVYNGALTTFYLLTIRYGWRQRKMDRIEIFLHMVPLLFGFCTAVAGIPLELYNPITIGCSIASYPLGCPARMGPCQRAPDAFIYQMSFFTAPTWLIFTFLVIAMSLIYQTISHTERNQNAHAERTSAVLGREGTNNSHQAVDTSTRNETGNRSTLRRQFATQALLYCVVYAVTWSFSTANFIVNAITNDVYVPMIFLHIVLSTLQGFWNAMVFIRPRYLKYRGEQRRIRMQAAEETPTDDRDSQRINDNQKHTVSMTS